MPIKAAPSGLPVDRIEFDMRQAEVRRDPRRERALAGARGADDDDAE